MLKKIKAPKDLQLEDPFFTIVQESVDEHKGNKAYSENKGDISDLPYYTRKEHKVSSVEYDERDKSLVLINKQFLAPAIGYNGAYPENAVVADEKVASDIVISLNLVSYDEAERRMKDAQGRKDFFEKTIRVYDPNLDCLKNRKNSDSFKSEKTVLFVDNSENDENEKPIE